MNGHQKQKEQSRQMMEEALFALMKEKNYGQITISELVKRADVSRRTFYRLYERKEDIIYFYFEKLCRDYSSRYETLNSYDVEKVAAEYFLFWYQHRTFLLLLHKNNLDDMLYYGIIRGSMEVMKKRIGDEKLRKMSELEYFADYSAGGFINLLYRWILSGMKENPEEYAASVSRAILQFVRPVRNSYAQS